MHWLLAVIISAGVYWWVSKPQRAYKAAHEKHRIHVAQTDKRITYLELASKRHNLRTARNMIHLGLVEAGPGPDEKHLQLIYDQNWTLNTRRQHLLAYRYGLVPSAPNYVGR